MEGQKCIFKCIHVNVKVVSGSDGYREFHEEVARGKEGAGG